ncbi:MAG: hypothetical protein J5871_04135 [Bacteroidales bacterium]|nr:hypothetical protein [Bacteroidales bacterium]
MKEYHPNYLAPDCFVLEINAEASLLTGSFDANGHEHIDYDDERTL